MTNTALTAAHQALAEQFIKAIEEGQATGKWVRPWVSDLSQRFTDGYEYTGSNQLFLSVYRAISAQEGGYTGTHPKLRESYERLAGTKLTQYWGSFNQWKEAGATVKAGAKGFPLVRQVTGVKKDKREDGTDDTYRYFTVYTVFNSTQVEGWTPPEIAPVEAAQAVRDRFQAVIDRHGIVVNTGTAAYYTPATDQITMPPIASFPVEDHYWSVLAHEAVHWTGHPSRLDRIKIGAHSGDAYAFEELVAELGSVFISAEFGIVPESDANILAYLGSWHSQIKKDKDCVRKAAAAAAAAANFLK